MSEIIGVTRPQAQPKCPDCKSQPVQYTAGEMNFGPLIFAQIFCHDCGHVFTVTPVGARQPQVMPAVPMPKIARN